MVTLAAVGVRANRPCPSVCAVALFASLLATLATTLPLSAQSASTGGLRGRILDQDGAPVEAALVTLVHTRTGATSTVFSVADGRYTLRGQRPGGPYRVTVTRIGFREFTREDIELLLGQFVNVDITVVSDAIEIEPLVVKAESDPEFNPGRIGISTLVTSQVLRELPTLTRNFLDFAALSPLVRTSEEGVSVAGASYRFNSLNIDGALNQDVFGLSTNNIAGGRAGARVIPLEAVEQFQVEVAPFDIRQSGFTGGALNAVTKSGTNEFATSAFGFYRGSGLVGELVEECLREQMNRILARNTCQTPWSHRLDLRVSQTVEARGFSAEMTLDMLNVLNLLNSSWGVVQIANPVVHLFRVRRPDEDLGIDPLIARYMGALQRNRASGKVRATRPFAPEVPTSQWRAQLGVRVSLGR